MSEEKKKPPVRPHWMEMYRSLYTEREALLEKLARLEGIEDVANRLKETSKRQAEEIVDVESDSQEKQIAAGDAEIYFLRKTVTDLSATIQQMIKLMGLE